MRVASQSLRVLVPNATAWWLMVDGSVYITSG
jgi:hypothetical protein